MIGTFPPPSPLNRRYYTYYTVRLVRIKAWMANKWHMHAKLIGTEENYTGKACVCPYILFIRFYNYIFSLTCIHFFVLKHVAFKEWKRINRGRFGSTYYALQAIRHVKSDVKNHLNNTNQTFSNIKTDWFYFKISIYITIILIQYKIRNLKVTGLWFGVRGTNTRSPGKFLLNSWIS